MTKSSAMRNLIAALAVVSTLPALAAQPSASQSLSEGFGRHLAGLINGYRLENGLGPLDLADDLASLASEHSRAMADRRKLSHDGFRERAGRSGSRVCVENVAWNYPTAEALLDGWRQSPAHHVNLLDPKVARMGIAVSTAYVTFFACR